jgi:hypothetical protein
MFITVALLETTVSGYRQKPDMCLSGFYVFMKIHVNNYTLKFKNRKKIEFFFIKLEINKKIVVQIR